MWRWDAISVMELEGDFPTPHNCLRVSEEPPWLSLNQRPVEFSFLYTTRSSPDLTFKQTVNVDSRHRHRKLRDNFEMPTR